MTVAPVVPALPDSPVSVRQEEKSIEISTGSLHCRIAKDGAHFIEALSLNGREVGRNGHLVAIREDRSEYGSKHILREENHTSLVTNVTIEQSGPVRAVVRVQGLHAGIDSSRKWLPFTIRLYFTAGNNSIRIVHSFIIDCESQSDFIRGLGLAFTVPFREEKQNRHIRFAADEDGVWGEPVLMSPGYREVLMKNAIAMNREQLVGQRIPNLDELGSQTKKQFETIALWEAFKLTQLAPDSFAINKRTGPASSWLHVADGHRARGMAFVGDVSGVLPLGVEHFWQKYPSELEITGASSDAAELRAWFWSPDAPVMDVRYYDVIGHDGRISYEDHQEGFSTPTGVANTRRMVLIPQEIPNGR